MLFRPQVRYETQILEGPVSNIGLNPDRCVVVVRVPEGANTPYVHNDGKIYIRVGDSSSPVPATDRSTFDLLYRRGQEKRTFLEELVGRSPEISQYEEDYSFLQSQYSV